MSLNIQEIILKETKEKTMKRNYEAVGKNVDVAIENGLKIIGKSREDVDIKILETGGLFKKAKVVLIFDDGVDENNKVEEQEQVEETSLNTNEVKSESKVEEVKPESKAEEKIVENLDEKEEFVEAKEAEAEGKSVETEPKRPKKPVDPTKLQARVNEFIKNILNIMQIQATISSIVDNNELKFTITGENVGKLIGYRGETLNALQYLLGTVKEEGEGKIRIYLDIEGYKEKREQVLIDLANKMADKAEEIERNVHLDPMSAYERRIIHTTLQNRTLVETESMGEGNKRHVVIKFKR